MTTADINAGLRLCREARWNQLEEDWRMFVAPPNRAWLIEHDGEVIGTSALARYDKLAWIAMMLVDPAERRAGHGRRLLSAALEAAGNVQCVGLDATPIGEPLYRKFGFVKSHSLVRLTFTGSPAVCRGEARPLVPADLSSICAVDREVFGADRSRLLASLLARAPESAWILDGRGYGFGRPGHLYHQLGPIVARDLETARALVTHALLDRPTVIDAPQFDSDWITWLKSIGFVEQRCFTRMFLRGHDHPGDPTRQYAIAGPEFA
jgi:GNAT superfamily N-acetyltransferase